MWREEGLISQNYEFSECEREKWFGNLWLQPPYFTD